MSKSPKKILIVGATGGTGRATVDRLLADGHHVTAFSRRPVRLGTDSSRLQHVRGDALVPSDVERAIVGHDAVVVTLGIRENPLRVRLVGPARTAMHVRSAGTANVIAAMRRHGVRRLVVQTSYGVGDTRGRLRVIDRLLFWLLLKPQIADTEAQTAAVVASGLDWVLVQPVHLTDDDDDDQMPHVSLVGETGRMKVSRSSVARVLAQAVENPAWVHASVSVSGPMTTVPARIPIAAP